MASTSTRDRLEASRGAIKAIYYVIVGIAITEALSRVFAKDGPYPRWRLFDLTRQPSVFLLVAFMLTISRFVHGASIHLDAIDSGRFKALFDFIGFLIQAALFYVMALSIAHPRPFVLWFIFMLVADALWLLVLYRVRYIQFGGTARQWVVSDAVLVAIFLGGLYFDPEIGRWSVVLVALCSAGAAVADYWVNRNFYFPKA